MTLISRPLDRLSDYRPYPDLIAGRQPQMVRRVERWVHINSVSHGLEGPVRLCRESPAAFALLKAETERYRRHQSPARISATSSDTGQPLLL